VNDDGGGRGGSRVVGFFDTLYTLVFPLQPFIPLVVLSFSLSQIDRFTSHRLFTSPLFSLLPSTLPFLYWPSLYLLFPSLTTSFPSYFTMTSTTFSLFFALITLVLLSTVSGRPVQDLPVSARSLEGQGVNIPLRTVPFIRRHVRVSRFGYDLEV
jgi:hypothetical protein